MNALFSESLAMNVMRNSYLIVISVFVVAFLPLDPPRGPLVKREKYHTD